MVGSLSKDLNFVQFAFLRSHLCGDCLYWWMVLVCIMIGRWSLLYGSGWTDQFASGAKEGEAIVRSIWLHLPWGLRWVGDPEFRIDRLFVRSQSAMI